ncbi:MAG TPA: homoserine dehydrogenase [Clostridia bacterium]|nr:homoserine dehydrogenase [Clostridia bacterium]
MYVAIMGYGVVGSGVAELLSKNHASIVKKSAQSQLELKYILDIRDFSGDVNEKLMIKDFNIILNDPEVDIVVETMGGLYPAFEFVKACLEAGKSVVTSNKELVAEKGYELLKIAAEKNVNFLFEASVGGGIPIIRPISQCLAANEIDEIAGILNGTTNFILTMMIEENMSFDDALKLAKENGYAESDPTADIEGIDACRKICILASLCFGKHVYPDEVYTEGITKISLKDVEHAGTWGGVIKLIGYAFKISDDKISVMVSPAIIKKQSQLAGVNGVFNAVLIRGDAIGDVVFYGKGAGKMPTASAVMADVIDCARHINSRQDFGWDDSQENYLADYLENNVSLYVRAKTKDQAGAVESIQKVFGDVRIISMGSETDDEIVFVTPESTEKELRTRLETLHLIEPVSIIRILDY